MHTKIAELGDLWLRAEYGEDTNTTLDGTPRVRARWMFGGQCMRWSKTIEEMGMKDGSVFTKCVKCETWNRTYFDLIRCKIVTRRRGPAGGLEWVPGRSSGSPWESAQGSPSTHVQRFKPIEVADSLSLHL
jgi:hypothetical protein